MLLLSSNLGQLLASHIVGRVSASFHSVPIFSTNPTMRSRLDVMCTRILALLAVLCYQKLRSVITFPIRQAKSDQEATGSFLD